MAYYFDHKHQREDHPAEHTDKPAMVFGVYLALLVGAILNIAVSFAHGTFGEHAIYVHMLISAVQVGVVGYYWMHLQRSDALTWLVAGSAIFIMLILFALPLSDYVTRQRGSL